MQSKPQIGSLTERQFVIESEHIIDFAGERMPAVLSTPALVGILERTAREALVPYLEAGENSVGMEVEIRHLAPTPPGHAVTCLARVIAVEGRRVTFALEARDPWQLIARGSHTRQIIRMDKFAQAVRRQGRS